MRLKLGTLEHRQGDDEVGHAGSKQVAETFDIVPDIAVRDSGFIKPNASLELADRCHTVPILDGAAEQAPPERQSFGVSEAPEPPLMLTVLPGS
jgi:hypothetical protein